VKNIDMIGTLSSQVSTRVCARALRQDARIFRREAVLVAERQRCSLYHPAAQRPIRRGRPQTRPAICIYGQGTGGTRRAPAIRRALQSQRPVWRPRWAWPLTPPELVDAISAAKAKCIETTIDLCFRLKQEVGSYALMGGSGFEKLDYLHSVISFQRVTAGFPCKKSHATGCLPSKGCPRERRRRSGSARRLGWPW
jgi:hypothetical protein